MNFSLRFPSRRLLQPAFFFLRGRLRTPLRDPAKWNEYSVAVRDSAGQLYKAARKKDFDACRKTYEQMLTNCNSCHKQFAGGKHMLAP